MSKSLATREQHELAERTGSALTPMQEVSREIQMRPEGDEEYRYQMRKLGNLHLGVKIKNQSGKEYPKATEYFVLPEALAVDTEFREALEAMGQDAGKPTRLPIMLMSDNIGANIVTSCDLYGMSGKLKCRSYDGRVCQRLNEKTSTYETAPCGQCACKDFEKGDCAWYHRVRFLLPDAAGIGYWQIATKSDNNRGALVREMLDLRKLLHGRLAGVDLMLTLTNEREFHVKPKTSDKMITTRPYLLHIEAGASLRKLMNSAQRSEVYDTDQIEESFDYEEQVLGEEEFDVGPPPEVDESTGEVVDAEVVDDELNAIRSSCVDLMEHLALSAGQRKAACIKASIPRNIGAVEELTADELANLLADLTERKNKGGNAV